MYEIETKILLRVLNRSRRWLYNQAHGYYDRNYKFHKPVISRDEIFTCMVNGKQVSYITGKGVEQIIDCVIGR